MVEIILQPVILSILSLRKPVGMGLSGSRTSTIMYDDRWGKSWQNACLELNGATKEGPKRGDEYTNTARAG